MEAAQSNWITCNDEEIEMVPDSFVHTVLAR